MDYRIREYGDVSSTNDIVKKAILDGEPEGLVVCAETQSCGYGRRGNPWSSAPGGVYMSLLLRPDVDADKLQSLPLVAAMAVRRSTARILPQDAAEDVKIKWPNDVVFVPSEEAESDSSAPLHVPRSGSFLKMCGISTEHTSGAVCLGIGVNVNRPTEAFSLTSSYTDNGIACAALRNIPFYIEDLVHEGEVLPADVREALLIELDSLYSIWIADGFKPLVNEYNEQSALAGSMVVVFADNGEAYEKGLCRGVDEHALLLVESCETGELARVASGTVSVAV